MRQEYDMAWHGMVRYDTIRGDSRPLSDDGRQQVNGEWWAMVV
jgi:hypothetical protein